MIKPSSSGYGQHKNKTLDVEVNLLSEWAAQKSRRRDQATRALTSLGVVIVAAAVTLPILASQASDAAARAARESKKAKAASADLASVNKELKNVEPELDAQSLKQDLEAGTKLFFGEVALLLNSAGPNMVFSTVKCDVLAGKMTMRCMADAASSAAAQDYIAKAGTGPRVKSSLLSSVRGNTSVGPNGVSFEFIKIVEVEQ